MYYGARYYSPAYRIFVQPDTMLPDPYNPQALNRYSYALNNPLKYTDPSGHIPVDTILDAASLVSSVHAFYAEPNLATGANLAWNVAAFAIPYLPGSWVIKAGKIPGGKIAIQVKNEINKLDSTSRTIVWAHLEADKEMLLDCYTIIRDGGLTDNSFGIPYMSISFGREKINNYLTTQFGTDAFNDIDRSGWILTDDGIIKDGKVLIEASSRSVDVLVWKDIQTEYITIEEIETLNNNENAGEDDDENER